MSKRDDTVLSLAYGALVGVFLSSVVFVLLKLSGFNDEMTWANALVPAIVAMLLFPLTAMFVD